MQYTLPTAREIWTKARRALGAGHLQCQREDFTPNFDECLYGAPCVIGAGLSPYLRQQLDNHVPSYIGGSAINDLFKADFVTVSPSDKPRGKSVRKWLNLLQMAHDKKKLKRLKELLSCETFSKVVAGKF